MSKLHDQDFDRLAALAHRKWGLSIDAKKRVIVENRLHSLGREFPIESIPSLVRSIDQGLARPLELALFDVLSTNHTSFFRGEEHFTLLRERILRPARSHPKGLRIWSAGCSRGCEPYTLSILLREVLRNPKARDDRILATDLSTGALSAARAGVYTPQEVADVSTARLSAFFRPEESSGTPAYRIIPELRDVVSFNLLNLLEPWQMKGPFDAIMCRNVMIYFDAPTREALARRLLALLRPGGLLFVASSESLLGYDLNAEQIIPGAYRKPGGAR